MSEFNDVDGNFKFLLTGAKEAKSRDGINKLMQFYPNSLWVLCDGTMLDGVSTARNLVDSGSVVYCIHEIRRSAVKPTTLESLKNYVRSI